MYTGTLKGGVGGPWSGLVRRSQQGHLREQARGLYLLLPRTQACRGCIVLLLWWRDFSAYAQCN
jgi:hypothetical protein